MLGLPGQTFKSYKKELQFCFDHKVLAVIVATSVMPNAPMADEPCPPEVPDQRGRVAIQLT